MTDLNTSPRVPLLPDVIRIAHPDEVDAIGGLVAAVYTPLPLCQWLAPRLATRGQVLTGYHRIHLTHVMRHGTVHAYGTGRLRAIAAWLPPDAPDLPPDYDTQLDRATGPWADQFRAVDYAVARRHATIRRLTTAAHRLVLLAVHPRDQRQGLGSALLAHYHARLDQHGATASADVPDQSLKDYLQRHGYQPTGKAFSVTDAAHNLWPLRREPPQPQPRSPALPPSDASDQQPTPSITADSMRTA